jgi:hypothetical protein
MVSTFTIGPKVRRFKTCRSDGVLKAIKNPQHAFFRNGSKAVGTMSKDFTACKKLLPSMNKDILKARFIIFFSKIQLLCY